VIRHKFKHMKVSTRTAVVVALLAWNSEHLVGQQRHKIGLGTKEPLSAHNELITAGHSVGNLQIGANESLAKSSQPSNPPGKWKDDCGEVLRWSTTSRTGIVGTLTARLKDGVVVQIDSANSRFHTAEGITADTSPDVVRQKYKGLHAYVSQITDMALGDKPVIYWIDPKKGIGFEFAYFPEEKRRYLYAVIVFQVGSELCPDGNKPDSQHWHEIAPYSLNPPDRSTELHWLRRPWLSPN
jgi:hypothetical protein